ncbi:MAG: hypothetical protein IT256_02905 [Chitinophagaceae bacterium]|nr:hypothetical protein [Chitinophagaceae bacterium]
MSLICSLIFLPYVWQMFFYKYYKFVFLSFSFLLVFSTNAMAQPTLPDLANVSQNGINILTWACQYDGVKTIIVQRSSDSNVNYVTIGYVRNTAKGVQFYLDGHPKPGPNWYRIKLVFGSDLTWTSNRIKVIVDSSQVAKGRVLPPNDSLQDLAAKFQTKTVQITDTATGKTNKKSVIVTSTVKTKDTSKVASGLSLTIELPDIEQVNAYSYIKSNYVFTNPFTGHVNIEIDDATKHTYNLDFYDAKNVKILEIPKIMEANVVLDKRNFQKVGMYKFDLYKDKVKLETGYITIY